MEEVRTDVVVMGAGFAGSSTALLIKRKLPGARVILIERKTEFDRKVGESTSEISACFLTRILGLGTWLGQTQLPKNGLRLWFARHSEQDFDDCVELGARDQTKLPAFQIDRSLLDAELLRRAEEAGCEVWRPAAVKDLQLNGTGQNELTVKRGKDEVLKVTAGYVIDASGKASVIAKQRGTWRRLEEHPTNAMWARFRGVGDWDCPELRARFPKYGMSCRSNRAWSTNHLLGYGWWCWIIPLKGGDYSIGMVYDPRLCTPPEGGSIAERIKAQVMTHPVGRQLFQNVELVERDSRAYNFLPYYSEEVAGDGWMAVGDAAGFLDPLYSPGLDFCAFTSSIAADFAARSLSGQVRAGEIAAHNAQFQESYRTWFEAMYLNKYEYMGDAELMSTAVLLDISTYFIGPVRLVYDHPDEEFLKLPFNGGPGRAAGRFMKWYHRRLVNIARKRRAAGVYGRRNAGWRDMYPGFTPDPSMLKAIRQALLRLGRLEWETAWLPVTRPGWMRERDRGDKFQTLNS